MATRRNRVDVQKGSVPSHLVTNNSLYAEAKENTNEDTVVMVVTTEGGSVGIKVASLEVLRGRFYVRNPDHPFLTWKMRKFALYCHPGSHPEIAIFRDNLPIERGAIRQLGILFSSRCACAHHVQEHLQIGP